MNIKSRLKKLEKDDAGVGAQVVIFRTFYENEDGSVSDDDAIARAAIFWGKLGGGQAHKDQDESLDEFEARVTSYEKMTWQEAQTAKGIIFYQN